MAGWNKQRRCTKDDLYYLYVVRQLGATVIKRELGLKSEKSVYVLLKQYQIPSRTISESSQIRENRKKQRTKKEVIDTGNHTKSYEERSKVYVACEEVNMIWDERDVVAFDSMWNEGLSIGDIANAFERDADEVVMLVMDRARKGFITRRQNGLYGRRMPA